MRHLHLANLPREVCLHLIGPQHKPHHRMIAGAVIMVAGVLIAKSAEHFHAFPAHVALDLVGYMIHGLGAVPYIEWLLIAEA